MPAQEQLSEERSARSRAGRERTATTKKRPSAAHRTSIYDLERGIRQITYAQEVSCVRLSTFPLFAASAFVLAATASPAQSTACPDSSRGALRSCQAGAQ